MKKILLVLLGLVILAVSFSGCGGGGENKKDDGMVDLWVLVAEYYDVPEDKQDQLGERACLYAYEYDKNGNLIENKEFSVGNPERYTVTTYQYNEHGDCISVKIDPTRQHPDMDIQPMVTEYEYEYDGELITKKTTVGGRVETYEYEGVRLQKIASGDGASVSEWHRKFDENGNMVEWCQRYPENGTDEVDRFVYSYDNKGRLIKIERFFNADTVSSWTAELRYDKNGHLETAVERDRNGQEEDPLRYKTDEHGNVVGYLSDNVQPFSFEYKKIRVTKERAEKLIRENNLLPQKLLHVSSGNLSYALLYRIEE